MKVRLSYTETSHRSVVVECECVDDLLLAIEEEHYEFIDQLDNSVERDGGIDWLSFVIEEEIT